jgi:hypothetical protein
MAGTEQVMERTEQVMERTGAEDLVDTHVHGGRIQGSGHPARTGTRVFAANPLVTFWSTVIGKKVVMAVTGAVLVAFVIGHMLGNLKIFGGPEDINAYARFLREVGTRSWAMDRCSGRFA